jgi:hypothetical protein
MISRFSFDEGVRWAGNHRPGADDRNHRIQRWNAAGTPLERRSRGSPRSTVDPARIINRVTGSSISLHFAMTESCGDDHWTSTLPGAGRTMLEMATGRRPDNGSTETG